MINKLNAKVRGQETLKPGDRLNAALSATFRSLFFVRMAAGCSLGARRPKVQCHAHDYDDDVG